MVDFQVVDKKFLENLQTTGRNRHNGDENPLIKALNDGQIISSTEPAKKFQGHYQAAIRRGKIQKMRSGLVDGVKTVVVWWEDKPAEEATA